MLLSGRLVRDRALSVADALLSTRANRLALHAAIAAWLAYRTAMHSFFAGPLIDGGIVTDDFMTHRVYLLVALCELGRIWRGKYGRADVAALCTLALMAFGAQRHGYTTWACDAVLVFAARGEDLRRLMRLCVAVSAMACATVVLSAAMGIIPDAIIEQGARIRHCLGFTYCLFPAQHLFTITCILCYLRDRNLSWMGLVALTGLNVACYLLTLSRLSLGLSLAALAVTALRKVIAKEGPWERLAHVMRWSFVAVTIISVLSVGAYTLQVHLGTTWLDGLNRVLEGRIGLTYRGLSNMGVRLFGQNVEWIGSGLGPHGEANSVPGSYNYVDNGFFHALIQLGVVYAIGLVALYTRTLFSAERAGRQQLTIVLALVALHLLLDDLALMLSYNAMLFALSASFEGRDPHQPRTAALPTTSPAVAARPAGAHPS